MKINLNTRIMSHSRTILSKKEKDIDDFIEKHPHLILSLSIGKLADKMEVGVSNLSRYIRKIGFKKYVDFRFYFAKRIEFIASNRNIKGNKIEQVVQNNANYMNYALKESASRISYELLKKACALIAHSEMTLCIGLGSSSLAAYDLSTKLMRSKINSTYYWDFHHIKQILRFLVRSPEKKVSIILFSRSLASKEIAEILDTINGAPNLKIIGVVSNKATKKYSLDFRLEYQILEMDSYFEVSSKIGQIYISSLIFHLISEKNK